MSDSENRRVPPSERWGVTTPYRRSQTRIVSGFKPVSSATAPMWNMGRSSRAALCSSERFMVQVVVSRVESGPRASVVVPGECLEDGAREDYSNGNGGAWLRGSRALYEFTEDVGGEARSRPRATWNAICTDSGSVLSLLVPPRERANARKA